MSVNYPRKHIVLAALITSMLILGFLFTSRGVATNENIPMDLKDRLRVFQAEWQIFTIWFVSPINGETYWDIPKSFEDDAGHIVARRLLTDVGNDHFCVDQINQGYTQSYCVPFSNIQYIDFLPENIEPGH